MKKAISLLAACSIFTIVCVGCGDSSDVDKNLVGSWNSSDLGGDLNFSEDGKLSLSVNYDDMGMNFNEDMKFVIEGQEIDVDYDGKKAVVDAGAAFNLDEEMIFVEMERTGEENKDSLDGEFKLTGGMIYDQLAEEFGENSPATYMVIDGEALAVKVDICDYKADGKKLTLTGDGLAMLEMDEKEAVLDYSIDGDKLTMTEKDKDGESDTKELTKVK